MHQKQQAGSIESRGTLLQPKRRSSMEKQVDLNSFDFLGELGSGSYGNVYLAKKKTTGKDYAIKRLSKAQLVSMKKEYQVLREQQALIKCDHPNIIKLHWSFADKKYLYMALDVASNGELFKLAKKAQGACLPYEACRFYMAEVVNALEHLAENRIVHRDLKPSNILLDEHMHVKLIDFGTALDLDRVQPPKPVALGGIDGESDNPNEGLFSSHKSTFVGTVDYMAPEIIAEEEATPAADLFSLGVMIYILLTGYKSMFYAQN